MLYYEENGIQIHHGDCRDILPTLPLVDLVLTDPPYGVGYADWDATIPPMEWLEIARKMAPIVMFTPGNCNQYDYPKPDWTACWFRPGSVQHLRVARSFSHWEPILIYGKNPLAFDAKEFNANTGEGGNGHPCAKPLALFKWLLAAAIPVSGTVIDPFMGSGTTLRAAKDLGLSAIGIELEEKYCEIAVRRLRQEVLVFSEQ